MFSSVFKQDYREGLFSSGSITVRVVLPDADVCEVVCLQYENSKCVSPVP